MRIAKVRFLVQFLDGYTDGKPSWLSRRPHYSTKEKALLAMEEMKERHPNRKYRIRKRTTR